MINTRWPRMDRPRQWWRYGGAWDIDDPYVPIAVTDSDIQVIREPYEKEEKEPKDHKWLLILALIIFIFAFASFCHKK